MNEDVGINPWSSDGETDYSRIVNQFFMIFNRLGSDGGLFIVIGKKNIKTNLK